MSELPGLLSRIGLNSPGNSDGKIFRAQLFTLRQAFAKVNEKLFFALWRLRFRAMILISFMLKRLLDAYIGEVILSMFIDQLLLKL